MFGMTHTKAITLAALLAVTHLAFGQDSSRSQNEQRIASLPEDQRVFQRFRFWVSGLPESERGSSGQSAQVKQDALLAKYSAWLVEGGFSAPEAGKQVTLLKKRGAAEDAEFWNRLLITERPKWMNSEPNGFLVETVKGRKPGRALDISMGQGRNAIWLAQQGWDVTGFDPADQAVAEARATAQRLGLTIHTEVATDDSFDFGENRWDLVVLSYAGCSELAARAEKALKPGGLLVEEAFHTDALKTMRIGGSLCGPGELPHAFQGLRVLRYEEPVAKPDFAPRPVRVVRFFAEKPAS
jgi:SAM-dependent methyltransferase